MERRRRGRETAERLTVFITIALYIAIFYYSPERGMKAIGYSAEVFFDVIFLVFAAICLGGLAKAALPGDLIVKFLSQERGIKAYFSSILIASLLPGEGYIRIPLFKVFLDKGAGIGPFTSLSSCRPLLINFPQGVAFLGLPIAIIQVIGSMVGALFAGLFAAVVQKRIGIIQKDFQRDEMERGP